MKYRTDFNPCEMTIKVENGKTVYLSPDGSDANDGLTIVTPKKTMSSALSVQNVQSSCLRAYINPVRISQQAKKLPRL